MFSKTPTRILRTIGTGLAIVSLGIGIVGGTGVAHGQPIGPSNTSCKGELIPPGSDDVITYPEGTVQNRDAGKVICVNGQWVSCDDPSLTIWQTVICAISRQQVQSSPRSLPSISSAPTLTSHR